VKGRTRLMRFVAIETLSGTEVIPFVTYSGTKDGRVLQP
jgi:hypothetical protein